MAKLTIYAHYGVLAHEKRPVYSPFSNPGDLCDELTVEIPFPVWRNYMDEPGVTIGGKDFLLWEVLTNRGDDPALVWYDGEKTRHIILKKASE